MPGWRLSRITTRMSVTIAARYSSQSGCSPDRSQKLRLSTFRPATSSPRSQRRSARSTSATSTIAVSRLRIRTERFRFQIEMASVTPPTDGTTGVATISLTSERSCHDVVMDSDVVQLHNGTRLVTDITDLIIQFCRKRGDGLCHVFVPHATAGVALIETGSGSEVDLEDAIDRLLPATAATGTGTAAAVTAVTTCCRLSCHRRSRCQCLAASPHSVPGRAWCLWTLTLITLTGMCGSASSRVDSDPGHRQEKRVPRPSQGPLRRA